MEKQSWNIFKEQNFGAIGSKLFNQPNNFKERLTPRVRETLTVSSD